jgi:hypothetical protein
VERNKTKGQDSGVEQEGAPLQETIGDNSIFTHKYYFSFGDDLEGTNSESASSRRVGFHTSADAGKATRGSGIFFFFLPKKGTLIALCADTVVHSASAYAYMPPVPMGCPQTNVRPRGGN